MTLTDLATTGEVAEATAVTCNLFRTPNHDHSCRKEHLRLKFAFIQPSFGDFPATHFWHVMSDGPFHHSTLSMQGLKEWKLL